MNNPETHSPPAACDLLIVNALIATASDNGAPYGETGATDIAITGKRIVDIGVNLSRTYSSLRTIDAGGQWLTPGLIDCHTHAVYGGDRADEFEKRLQGVSYTEIAKAGGGILGTVKHTREASDEALLLSAESRVLRLADEGVTTIEIKSGYGLTTEDECKMLRVATQLGQDLGLHVSRTFLGAHALPPEFADDADGYIDYVCNDMMPTVAEYHLADAVDVFCESIGFTPDQTQQVFRAAQSHGLPVKGHVEQLTDQKGAVLAASFNALSVDHIEYLAEEDVPVLAESGTVAVLLPGAFYYLNETQRPPMDALRKHNVPMAVATDLNPGTSPLTSIHTAMNMACVLFGLTPEEAFLGVTRHAAQALGLQNKKGQLAIGYDADILFWDFDHPRELSYAINAHRPAHILIGGQDA